MLKVELSFQVHEPGFWGMFEKRQNLDGDGVDFVIDCAIGYDDAARKFCCDENREQGSFDRRWVKTRKIYFFITVCLVV